MTSSFIFAHVIFEKLERMLIKKQPTYRAQHSSGAHGKTCSSSISNSMFQSSRNLEHTHANRGTNPPAGALDRSSLAVRTQGLSAAKLRSSLRRNCRGDWSSSSAIRR